VRSSLAMLLTGLLVAGCSGSPDRAAAPPQPSGSPSASPAPAVASPTLAPAVAAKVYRDGLRPTIESVYDQVQPLQDAFDAFARPRPESALVRDDVFAAAGAQNALAARRAELAATTPPAALRGQVAQLDAGLAQLQRAAVALAAATKAQPGADGVVQEYVRGERALGVALRDYRRAVSALYAGQPVPSAPAPDRAGAVAGRAPLSHGAWLLAAGRVCGRTSRPLTAARELPALPRPKPDAALLTRTVMIPLQELRRGGGRPAQTRAAVGLASYGSSACAELFRPDEG
jgi:hypothetical protein